MANPIATKAHAMQTIQYTYHLRMVKEMQKKEKPNPSLRRRMLYAIFIKMNVVDPI